MHLIRHRDRVVTKVELLDTVWGDRFVSESALASRLKSARRAVGDDGSGQRVIRTVFGRGYQFVAPVVEHHEPGTRAPPATAISQTLQQQTVRFCTASDGHRIAYATIGSGPVLVKAANWLTHLDHDRETSVWAHWLEGLARGRTLLRYDERGCGMSDWDVEHFRFEDWVDDLETVVDAAGLDQFPLLGVSQGAAVAVAFAAEHPERVTRLVLASAYARGRLARATDDDQRREAALDLEVARRRMGSRRPVVPSGVHVAVPAGRRTRGVGGVQRPATDHDVTRERRALPRDVRPDRRHRAGAEGEVPHARHALPRRLAAAGRRRSRARRPDPRLPVRPAPEPQPSPAATNPPGRSSSTSWIGSSVRTLTEPPGPGGLVWRRSTRRLPVPRCRRRTCARNRRPVAAGACRRRGGHRRTPGRAGGGHRSR